MCVFTPVSVHPGAMRSHARCLPPSPSPPYPRRPARAGARPQGAARATRSQWQLRTQTALRVSAARIGCRGQRGRGSAEGGAAAVRERPPCCGSCGGAGAPTSTASCPGWPSTSAASAGEARGKVPGASPDPAAPRRNGLGRRRSSHGFVTQKWHLNYYDMVISNRIKIIN